MRRVLIALALLAVLVFAPAAFAGGWATVGLSSTPAGDAARESRGTSNITVLQHGRTPLEDVQPTSRSATATRRRRSPPSRRGKPGVYRASVIFPTAGRWTYEVDDGFISEPAAHVPGRARSASPPAPATAPPTTRRPADDGGPRCLARFPGIALLAAAAAILLIRDRAPARPGQQPQAA